MVVRCLERGPDVGSAEGIFRICLRDAAGDVWQDDRQVVVQGPIQVVLNGAACAPSRSLPAVGRCQAGFFLMRKKRK